ncbi:MAG TPA: prolyl oligopeptidase family serine peptidase [Vicinamibacterales bacterium]|nr:prolyl oligopeptidase family serine peptidase [Vicinamibacterales bacterium]
MRSRNVVRGILAAGLLVSVQLAQGQISFAQQAASQGAPATGAPQAGRGGGRGPVDPRVQQRTYTFADTNEQMPYALFVSSKVTRDKKNPLIVSLHGLGGDQNTMVRESLRSVELAERGGYILVAPMGYNSAGWYGIPPGPPRPANAAGRGGGTPRPVIGGTAITDAAKVREASAEDVMTVLDMVRKEFSVDERRTYLMGHSMGGAGTYYLGSKYGDIWAALAPIAPAAMGMTNNRTDVLQAIKAARVPMLVSMGDADEAVPVANVRMWVDTMKELQMNYEYKEYPGVTHGPIIAGSMADIYAFFAKHSKPAAH